MCWRFCFICNVQCFTYNDNTFLLVQSQLFRVELASYVVIEIRCWGSAPGLNKLGCEGSQPRTTQTRLSHSHQPDPGTDEWKG